METPQMRSLIDIDIMLYRPTACVKEVKKHRLACGPMPNVMAALPNIGGALCSTPHSLADAHYYSAVQ